MKIHDVIETVRLNHSEYGEGTAYVIDRLSDTTPAQIKWYEDHGAIVSTRAYRYAPEIVETFVFVPDSVMVWACPNDECSGLYGERPQILEKSGDSWECPVCGCSTSFPAEDACIPMIEHV